MKTATELAQQIADQELEACCKLLELSDPNAREFLCAARRPKQPSLKEQALEQLRQIPIDPEAGVSSFELDIIRQALEQLPDE